MTTYVLDSGALIALERRKPRGRSLLQLAARGDAMLVVPQPVATSDVDDFARFAPMFPGVRVLAL